MAPEKKYGSVEEGAEDVVPDSKPRDYKVNALRVLAGVAVVCVGLAGAAAARGASKEMELKTLPIAEAQGIWKAHSWTPKTLDDLSDPSPTKDESRIKIKGNEIHIQHADDQKFRTDSLPYPGPSGKRVLWPGVGLRDDVSSPTLPIKPRRRCDPSSDDPRGGRGAATTRALANTNVPDSSNLSFINVEFDCDLETSPKSIGDVIKGV